MAQDVATDDAIRKEIHLNDDERKLLVLRIASNISRVFAGSIAAGCAPIARDACDRLVDLLRESGDSWL
jgi:hypothetical protein